MSSREFGSFITPLGEAALKPKQPKKEKRRTRVETRIRIYHLGHLVDDPAWKPGSMTLSAYDDIVRACEDKPGILNARARFMRMQDPLAPITLEWAGKEYTIFAKGPRYIQGRTKTRDAMSSEGRAVTTQGRIWVVDPDRGTNEVNYLDVPHNGWLFWQRGAFRRRWFRDGYAFLESQTDRLLAGQDDEEIEQRRKIVLQLDREIEEKQARVTASLDERYRRENEELKALDQEVKQRDQKISEHQAEIAKLRTKLAQVEKNNTRRSSPEAP